MAEIKITELPVLANMTDDTVVPVVESNTTSQISSSNVKSYVLDGLSNITDTVSFTGGGVFTNDFCGLVVSNTALQLASTADIEIFGAGGSSVNLGSSTTNIINVLSPMRISSIIGNVGNGNLFISSGAGSTSSGNVRIETANAAIAGNVNIAAGNSTDNEEDGGDVRIESGSGKSGGKIRIKASGGTVEGGGVTIFAGDGPDSGGELNISAGDGNVGGSVMISSGNGTDDSDGDITLQAGTNQSAGDGGSIVMQSGSTDAGNSGNIVLTGGFTTSGVAADIKLSAGSANNSNGGNVVINAGSSVSGSSGNVNINANGGNVTIGNSSSLTTFNGSTSGINYEDLSNTDVVVVSDATGITGASTVSNIVSLSQSDYNAIANPDASTLYVITG